MWGIFTQWENERESGNREPRVLKGLLSLDWGVPHLRCLFTPLFTHCHPQLIPPGDWGACPLQGPWTHPGPLWMPNWAYRSADWINSSVSGTFSPSTEEGDYSTPAWDPCTIPQKTEQREAGGEGGAGLVAGESKGSEGGVVETVQKTCPFLLANRGWKCERGATKGLSLHRTSGFQQGQRVVQDRASKKTGLLRTYITSAQSAESFCGVTFLTIHIHSVKSYFILLSVCCSDWIGVKV